MATKSRRRVTLENIVTPWWIRAGLPWVTWRKHSSQNRIYLTFDDGPTKTLTPVLLSILKHYDAKATFFCLGKNVKKFPGQFAAIVNGGHAIGNHTHSHPNGWQTKTSEFVNDVQQAQAELTTALGFNTKLFRPPFGRLSIGQMFRLRNQFRVVMWDILSLDYSPNQTSDQVAENVTGHANAGSIVLLHDSELAEPRVVDALPQILEHFSKLGFEFCALDQD